MRLQNAKGPFKVFYQAATQITYNYSTPLIEHQLFFKHIFYLFKQSSR